ncbi:MAG TPA: SpoIIE family protein phosphatase [Terriglobia bacterium]
MSDNDDGKLLLVVDDSPSHIHMVRSILKDDYKIRIATSGAQALDLARSEPMPDLILLDVMLPDMNGYEVCQGLKANQETRDIPVMFLTLKMEVADEARGFEVGAVDYIHKPFSPPIVKARVRTHLLLREANRKLAQQLSDINNELEMARQVQFAILPSATPKIRGLNIAARYIPMTSVAGDFYDFIVVDEAHLGVLIADVSGHGLPSALIASMLQSALAAQSPHAADAARVLRGLNQALVGKFQSHFVTAAYLFLDLQKGVGNYAGAGHPPLLVWRETPGSVSEVLENGLVLGLLDDSAYSSVPVSLEGGDRIVLYTDGIVEATNSSGEELGLSRFKGMLEEKRELSADAFADTMVDGVLRWSEKISGPSQSDDITLLAIDFKDASLAKYDS